MTISQTIPSLWHAAGGDSPSSFAGLFRQAAKLIRSGGYSPAPEGWQAEGPQSVSSAIVAAARLAYPDSPADAAGLAEDAHARLAGVLYLTGAVRRRTSIRDICDSAARWEDGEFTGWPARLTRRTQDEAIGLLETAAAMLGALERAE